MLPCAPLYIVGRTEHTFIYLLYVCMYVCLYTYYIQVGGQLYIGGGISNYYSHTYIPPICRYAHTLIYILYISNAILLYTYYISLCVIVYIKVWVQPYGKQEVYLMGWRCLTVFVAARAYRVCKAVVSNETIAYRANCELLFVVVV